MVESAPFLFWLTPLAAVLAVFAVVAFVQRQGEQRRINRVKEFVAQRGWDFRPNPGHHLAFAISGTEAAVRWELTADRVPVAPARGQRAAETVWRTADARLPGADDLVLIGLRPPGMKGELHLDHWLAGGLTRPTLRLLFDVDPRGLSLQAVGSSLFQDKYLVLGRPEEAARRLMSSALKSQMLDWTELPSAPLGPQVAVDANGVLVRLRMGRVAADEPAVLERLTAIRAAAAAALRRDISR